MKQTMLTLILLLGLSAGVFAYAGREACGRESRLDALRVEVAMRRQVTVPPQAEAPEQPAAPATDEEEEALPPVVSLPPVQPDPKANAEALEALADRVFALERLVSALHEPVDLQAKEGDVDLGPLVRRLDDLERRVREAAVTELRRRLKTVELDLERDVRNVESRVGSVERELRRIERDTGERDFHRLIRDLANAQERLDRRLDELGRANEGSRQDPFEMRELERDIRSLRTDLQSLRDRVSRLERDR